MSIVAASTAIDEAIAQCDRLRAALKKSTTPQIRSADERALIKANAFAWFNKQREPVASVVGVTRTEAADAAYKALLVASDRSPSRSKVVELIKSARIALIEIRSHAVAAPQSTPTADAAPQFAKLIGDVQMRSILDARWKECLTCLAAGAPLAATVMMGGLLEALLLARVNRESNKSPIFTAPSAPKDKAGKSKPLNEWTLKNYIDVAHDLGWVTVSAKDVGEVLRDYRNFVHPFKQLSHGIKLVDADARLLWEITKNISRQLLL